jgi:dTDP-4-dehydrorhamnose 3,5-epimerase
MNAVALSLSGAYLLESPVFEDPRGLSREWYRVEQLEAAGHGFEVRQANFSTSVRDVVRGLHYSLAPQGQAKVVTCVAGELDDVLVDVRVGSPTYGRHEYVELAEGAGLSVVVPAGVAHGFCVRSERASIVYLLSSQYNPAVELEVHALDPALGVPWRLSGEARLSAKDAAAPPLAERRARGQLPTFTG